LPKKRKLPVPKTKEQVEEEIKRAEEFAKEHPTSMFGDNNVKKVERFKRICNAYLDGKNLDELADKNDENADDGLIGNEESSEIDDYINWLRGELDVDGEGHFW
jgi:hypothetical protein